jgi:competence protein ComEC
MARVCVLDVGHGNAALLQDQDLTVIVDAPRGPALVDALRDLGVTKIDRALISHADADHLGGMSIILTENEFTVREVRLNPDPTQQGIFFDDFQVASILARQRCGTELRTELTVELGDQLSFGRLRVEILHPPAHLAVSGVGGATASGQPLGAHSLSAVFRVSIDEVPVIVLPGDLDDLGLAALTESLRPGALKAHCLVFPHHGGGVGGPGARDFARQLCSLVEPEIVAFSIGRGKYGTPRPTVVRGVREARPRVHIACTQLSERCAPQLASIALSHVADLPARGFMSMESCAGSLVFEMTEGAISARPRRADHESFVRRVASTPLCMIPVNQLAQD